MRANARRPDTRSDASRSRLSSVRSRRKYRFFMAYFYDVADRLCGSPRLRQSLFLGRRNQYPHDLAPTVEKRCPSTLRRRRNSRPIDPTIAQCSGLCAHDSGCGSQIGPFGLGVRISHCEDRHPGCRRILRQRNRRRQQRHPGRPEKCEIVYLIRRHQLG